LTKLSTTSIKLTKVTPRDLVLARRAKKHGANYSLRIIIEARQAVIPISLGFALIEKESGFRNVFGHDPTTSIPVSWRGTQVTKSKYEHYKANRASGGMQGVGPAQLTWWAYQDQADHRGGCWIPKHNISVAFDHLAALLKINRSKHGAIAKYNGTGSAADKYASDVAVRQAKWHSWL
jgi:hypothetical protein